MTKKDYVQIDGIRYRKEVPSTEIKRDALFYAFTTSTLGGALRTKLSDDVQMLTGQEPGWGPGGAYRIPVDVPPEIGPWTMEKITCPPEAVTPFLSDLSVEEKYADWVPDIWASHLALIVTAPVRQVIEELDPGFHYFYPMTIRVTQTGDALPGERFHWVPRRRMYLQPDPEADPLPGAWSAWMGGGFSGRKEVWQYQNNTALRTFLAELPFWVEGMAKFSFAMSRPVFQRLKSEAFTGLLEIECEDRYDEDCDRSHNVGHF